MAFSIHLAMWYAPGFLKYIPPAGTQPRKIIDKFKSSW